MAKNVLRERKNLKIEGEGKEDRDRYIERERDRRDVCER
jgi:hypothetical protein